MLGMPTLRRSIEALAEDFATKILKALHSAPFSELAAYGNTAGNGLRAGGGSGVGNGRSTRGSVSVEAIVEALRSAPEGLRNDQLQKALGVSSVHLAKPLKSALDSKAVTKKGQRRGTTYFAA